MRNFNVLCNKCKKEVDFKCNSKFIRVKKESFLCHDCNNELRLQNKKRICPKCNTIIIHANSRNKKMCENRICKKCRSNNIPKEFTENQQSFFNGLMLGDGGLVFAHKSGALYPRLSLQRQKIDCDYLFWQYELFKDFHGTEPKYFIAYHNRVNKYYDGYALRTKSGQIFKDNYDKWYPDSKKIIPKDLILNPLTLLIWFLDDGCVIKDSKNSLTIKFSTDGFSKDDVIFLANLLNSYIESQDIHYYKNANGFILKGSTLAAVKIIKIIDPIFPPCMERKRIWKDFNFDYFNQNIHCYGKVGGRDNNINLKLNYDKATEIRRLFFEQKISKKDLAKLYNVSCANIYSIVTNKIWIGGNHGKH